MLFPGSWTPSDNIAPEETMPKRRYKQYATFPQEHTRSYETRLCPTWPYAVTALDLREVAAVIVPPKPVDHFAAASDSSTLPQRQD